MRRLAPFNSDHGQQCQQPASMAGDPSLSSLSREFPDSTGDTQMVPNDLSWLDKISSVNEKQQCLPRVNVSE